MVHEILGYKKVNKQYFFWNGMRKTNMKQKIQNISPLLVKNAERTVSKLKNVSNPSLE